MMQKPKDRLRFALFTSVAPGGPPGALWDHPRNRGFDYLNVHDWTNLARKLESAKFDAIFWADCCGVHDIYQDSYATAVREAVQFPVAAPSILAGILAAATENLGVAYSSNIIQSHPYAFARELSTLDHFSRGRVAWNIVTSFQPSAWRNLGHANVAGHGSRYKQAAEYADVIYKLLEGSWQDDAVVRDIEKRMFADPARVHPINHAGENYTVPGIHTNEPSAQRVPVLFQAGSSEDGRAFAARNAECMFIAVPNLRAGATLIADMERRLVAAGRLRSDLLYFQILTMIVGGTEEEAKKKDAETQEYLSSETNLAFFSSNLGLDLSQIDLDTPLGDFHTESLQGQLRSMAEAIPDKSLTFRDVVVYISRNRIVGTPEQIADILEQWRDIGVNGINLGYQGGISDIHDFIDGVVPLLQQRGLMQTDYAAGTMREKLFAGTASPSGPRLNERHPASRHRRAVV